MRKTDILLRLLQNTMGLSAFCWDGTPQMLADVEKKHCFSRQAQPLLTVEGLQTILENIKPSTLYEIEDPLGIHFCVFLFHGEPVWAGSFVVKEWEDAAAERSLMKRGLPASCLLPYKLYYCSHSLLDQNTSARVVTGVITALLPDSPPYTFQNITGLPQPSLPDLSVREPLDFENVMRQYELENRFLSMVEEGRTEAALEAWDRLSKIPYAKELSIPGLHSMIANATILRTLTRKAAERGGVHPAVVDTISVAYAQKTYTARSKDELMKIIPAMIREFSDAVCSSQGKQYSPAIKLVVNYLKLHYSQEISMKQLASLINCAPNYLGRRFKAETGMTVVQFLAQERCHSAANLLVQTDLSVQDISAYVGYLDSNYFVKVFKNYIGETPTAYRSKFHR